MALHEQELFNIYQIFIAVKTVTSQYYYIIRDHHMFLSKLLHDQNSKASAYKLDAMTDFLHRHGQGDCQPHESMIGQTAEIHEKGSIL